MDNLANTREFLPRNRIMKGHAKHLLTVDRPYIDFVIHISLEYDILWIIGILNLAVSLGRARGSIKRTYHI